MAERTARLGSMFYRDSDGRYRTASAGDTIQVHPDYLERFDRLNVLLGQEPGKPEPEKPEEPQEPEKPAPKRRGRPPRKAD